MRQKAVIKMMTPQAGPVASLMKEILESLGEDPNREGLLKTPERYEKAMRYMLSGYHSSLNDIVNGDRKSTRLNSSHPRLSRMPSSA